ncbi:hypothetical protein [Clostridium oryzae]|uniref:Uncharacterized protein n=1 Tax=Clostridium oryzae TaxID=1450648 RepID=A0A1V4IIE8_9CLOT|nr:hypothetical protein [Clostridium oryzae]OPJ59706.1 hypothetical protein CLORY_31540 [Clostridium oryzae]
MNNNFVKNMLMAEKYKYKAIKELLPESMKKRAQLWEKNAVNLLKDIAVEIVSEETAEQGTTAKKEVKKVKVDFSE